MADLQTLLQNPDFKALSGTEKIKVYAKGNKDFAALPLKEQAKVMARAVAPLPEGPKEGRGYAQTIKQDLLSVPGTVANAVVHPRDTGRAIGQDMMNTFQSASQEKPGSMAQRGRQAAAFLPVIGPAAVRAGEELGEGVGSGLGGTGWGKTQEGLAHATELLGPGLKDTRTGRALTGVAKEGANAALRAAPKAAVTAIKMKLHPIAQVFAGFAETAKQAQKEAAKATEKAPAAEKAKTVNKPPPIRPGRDFSTPEPPPAKPGTPPPVNYNFVDRWKTPEEPPVPPNTPPPLRKGRDFNPQPPKGTPLPVKYTHRFDKPEAEPDQGGIVQESDEEAGFRAETLSSPKTSKGSGAPVQPKTDLRSTEVKARDNTLIRHANEQGVTRALATQDPEAFAGVLRQAAKSQGWPAPSNDSIQAIINGLKK